MDGSIQIVYYRLSEADEFNRIYDTALSLPFGSDVLFSVSWASSQSVKGRVMIMVAPPSGVVFYADSWLRQDRANNPDGGIAGYRVDFYPVTLNELGYYSIEISLLLEAVS